MLHCNWGWGGDSDGYFTAGVFDTANSEELDDGTTPQGGDGYDFKYNINLYYELHPK
jgi:hypothetical protein